MSDQRHSPRVSNALESIAVSLERIADALEADRIETVNRRDYPEAVTVTSMATVRKR